MAQIHITEIIKYLDLKRSEQAGQDKDKGFFLELMFNDLSGKKAGFIDEELKEKVITADCSYGGVTILFDEEGQLKTLEIC